MPGLAVSNSGLQKDSVFYRILKYFGTQINATLMNSEMTLGQNTNNPKAEEKFLHLIRQRILYKLQLFYETGKLNVRAALLTIKVLMQQVLMPVQKIPT